MTIEINHERALSRDIIVLMILFDSSSPASRTDVAWIIISFLGWIGGIIRAHDGQSMVNVLATAKLASVAVGLKTLTPFPLMTLSVTIMVRLISIVMMFVFSVFAMMTWESVALWIGPPSLIERAIMVMMISMPALLWDVTR